MKLYLLVMTVILVWGCDPRWQVISEGSEESHDWLVGKTVRVKGEVAGGNISTVAGIACMELGGLIGKRVAVVGDLRRCEITEGQVASMNSEGISHRGSGVYYELVNVRQVQELR